MIVVAIDIGGTFTDVVGFDDKAGRFVEAKSLTTPHELTQGVFDCIRKSGIAAASIDELIHGSTIAINTLIERSGAKTGLIVTSGTRNVYIIGRGNRPEAYNLFFHRHRPLVPRHLTREIEERLLSSGEIFRPLNKASVTEACRALAAAGVEAVAVCLLHSYVDPAHERIAGAMVSAALPHAYLSLSHDILREYREFERLSTTVVNAYIGPKVGGYVRNLKSRLSEVGFAGELSIMRSNGGVMPPEVAMARPVAMMESGPVGGIIASARVGEKLGFADVISFDMGGTTAKTSLVRDGEPTLAPGYYVGGYASGHPVMLPMIDVVEVGAGGGSIAWTDDVGALKVGPQSAGADPGPICYRGGGTEPTITDANVVLGRLDPKNFLGGEIVLDAEGARAGIERKIAQPLADGHGRGGAGDHRDRDFQNVARGARSVGGKGLRSARFCAGRLRRRRPAARLRHRARLHIPKVIVPLFPSHFSALGMLLADERHDFIRTFYCDLASLDFKALNAVHDEMTSEAKKSLRHSRNAQWQIALDLRYVGQEFTLSVPVSREAIKKGERQKIRAAFDALYEHRYAHQSPDEPVEMVNIRLAAVGKRPQLRFPRLGRRAAAKASRRRDVYLDDPHKPVACPIYQRGELGSGARLKGPALIEEHGTTTVLFEQDRCTVAPSGELIIDVGGAR